MLRKGCLALLLIALMVSSAYGETLEAHPEWLHGKVAIDLYGDDRELGAWPYERYICIFNLDNHQIDSIKIPDDSILIKEWLPGGRLGFASPHSTGYPEGTEYMDGASRWRAYAYTQIIPEETEEGTIYRRGESAFDVWLNEDVANERVFYDILGKDSLLTVLGLSEKRVYDDFSEGWLLKESAEMIEGLYLIYGLSDEGEIEIQLQKFEDGKCSVLYHFPLEYDFEFWHCAISPAGAIAWWNRPNELICVNNGESFSW